jgi:hypothetical protein
MIKYLKNLEIFFDSDGDKKKYISIVQFAFLISAIFELGGIFLLGPLIFIATSGADSLSNQYVSLAYNLIGKDFADFFLDCSSGDSWNYFIRWISFFIFSNFAV